MSARCVKLSTGTSLKSLKPLAVIATVGIDINSQAVDPIPEIAKICREK